MNAVLKAKFLQHLSKKKSDQGFTLIELLVVIIIVGILSAIALPSFLNQATRARQTEAENNISTYNSQQNAFRTAEGRYATSFDELAMGSLTGAATDATDNYNYTMAASADAASLIAVSLDTGVKGYTGGASQYINAADQPTLDTVICQAKNPGTATVGAPTFYATAEATCPANTTELGT